MEEKDTIKKGTETSQEEYAPNHDWKDVSVRPATADSNPNEVSGKDKMLIVTISGILLVILALAIVGFIFIKQGPETIQGQGEATEIRISGKLPGRVMEIYVEEGQHVHAGDTLVRISSKLVDAQLKEAKAMENVAIAGKERVDAGTRQQVIQSARDIWQQAQSATGIARKTYERMESLYAKGVVSAQKRDEAKAAYDMARSGEAAAKSSYELAAAGPIKEDRNASSAMVAVAQSGVGKVDALLDDQYLLAPCDGDIIVIYPNVSELIATGAPVMSLQKDDHWAVFNMRETFLKDIKNGTKLKVYIPALDKDTVMKVFYIKDLGTYANWQATKATGDYDARTFSVKARPERPIANFRPGMSVIYKGVAD